MEVAPNGSTIAAWDSAAEVVEPEKIVARTVQRSIEPRYFAPGSTPY